MLCTRMHVLFLICIRRMRKKLFFQVCGHLDWHKLHVHMSHELRIYMSHEVRIYTSQKLHILPLRLTHVCVYIHIHTRTCTCILYVSGWSDKNQSCCVSLHNHSCACVYVHAQAHMLYIQEDKIKNGVVALIDRHVHAHAYWYICTFTCILYISGWHTYKPFRHLNWRVRICTHIFVHAHLHIFLNISGRQD